MRTAGAEALELVGVSSLQCKWERKDQPGVQRQRGWVLVPALPPMHCVAWDLMCLCSFLQL